MKILRLIVALACLAGVGLQLWADSDSADAPHLHVRLVVPAQTLVRGQSAQAGLYFKMEPGWHVYWANAGDSGEPPRIRWTLPEGISAGPLEFLPPKRLPLGPLMDFGYEGEVLFPFSIDVAKSTKEGTAVLRGRADWLVCREVCIPGKAELSVSRKVAGLGASADVSAADAALVARFAGQLPKPLPAGSTAVFQPTAEGFRLAVKTGQREQSAEFFPADQSVLDNPSPQTVTPTADGAVLSLKKDANLTAAPAQLRGVVELSGGRAYEIAATPSVVPDVASSAVAPRASVPKAIESAGLAFLGGLLLNLMPCVFPVLFIKGLALVRSGSEERGKLRAHGFVYAAGILISFWVLVAALLALRAAGARLGWGFQFQSPVFLILMAGLLFFLGLSLAGQFEIGLSLTSTGGSLAAEHGYAGSFFTGVLAVIVATPCTAPFMGAAVGYALSQSAIVTFAIFTALALGLAAPYVLLTLQPAWTRLLPKPGVWMEVLKQATAVPVFATVIGLAWVLAQAYGAALLAALLVCLLLLAIAGWFLGRWPAKGWATTIASAIVLGVLVLGIAAPGRLVMATASSASGAAHGEWQPWTTDAVARYQAEGRPVFVDFTASWCLSCQVNERVALDRPQVQKAFSDANVALLRADWTQHDESIGQALTALGRDGVPAYALYAPGQSQPQLLPEVLTPGIVIDAVEKLPRATAQGRGPA